MLLSFNWTAVNLQLNYPFCLALLWCTEDFNDSGKHCSERQTLVSQRSFDILQTVNHKQIFLYPGMNTSLYTLVIQNTLLAVLEVWIMTWSRSAQKPNQIIFPSPWVLSNFQKTVAAAPELRVQTTHVIVLGWMAFYSNKINLSFLKLVRGH